jgi:hypothetical protein
MFCMCFISNSWSIIGLNLLYFNPLFSTDKKVSHYLIESKSKDYCERKLYLHGYMWIWSCHIIYQGYMKGSRILKCPKEVDSQTCILRFSCELFPKESLISFPCFIPDVKLCKGTESFIHRINRLLHYIRHCFRVWI